MSYVQRFSPKGNDLETLRFFMNQKLTYDFNDPSQQALVAQQVYDTVRGGGRHEGSVTIMDLQRAYESLIKARAVQSNEMTPMAKVAYEEADPGMLASTLPQGVRGFHSQYGHIPLPHTIGQGLLPRTAMQSPIEAMRPTRHMHADDQVADAAGAFLYHAIDSATLGILGGLGGVLKKLGVTDKNFWTESVGETESFLGMDFGSHGLKGADSTAGQWASAAGELAGFLGPGAAKIVAKPGAALVKGAVGAVKAGRAARLSKALSAGKIADDLVPQTAQLVRTLKGGSAAQIAAAGRKAKQGVAGITAAERGLEAAAKGTRAIEAAWKYAPASAVFRGGHKILNRFFVGRGAQKVAQQTIDAALDGTKTFGSVLPRSRAAIAKAAGEAAKAGTEAGYATARTAAPSRMALGLQEGILGNAAVNQAASGTFQAKFMELVAKNTNIGADSKVLGRLAENAAVAFESAFLGARKSGHILTLAEKAATSGSTGLGLGLRKLFEESANHATGMVLLGLATRTMHPLAEPEIFGMDEDAGFAETVKDIGSYWLRGNPEGNPLFEGVIGDIWVGSMFATGGGLKLFKPFQKRRVQNPKEALSIALGGNSKQWKKILDATDRELHAIYRTAPRKGGNLNPKSFLRRNKVDFKSLTDRELEVVAKNYLGFMEQGGMKVVPGIAGRGAPFTFEDIAQLGSNAKSRNLIVEALGGHLDEVLHAYRKGVIPNLAKDLASFGAIATATAFNSSPQLFIDWAEGHGDIHISSLATHSVFSMLAARHPYYMTDAPSMFAKGRGEGEVHSREFQNQVRLNGLRNALRRLGVRDSAYFLEGYAEGENLLPAGYGPREATQDLNGIAERIQEQYRRSQETGEKAEYQNFEVVTGIEDVVDSSRQLTQRELKSVIDYVKSEGGRGTELHEIFTATDSKGKAPVLDSQDLYFRSGKGTVEGGELMDKMVGVGIELKKALTEKGFVEPGQELHIRDIERANISWQRNFVNSVRDIIGGRGNTTGIRAFLQQNMPTEMGERLRKIAITLNQDGKRVASERPRDVQVQDAWNEFVEIVADFNLAPHETKRDAFEIRVEPGSETEGMLGVIEQAMVNFEKRVNDAGDLRGTRSFTVGDKRLHRMLVESVLSSKIDDSTHILAEGGTLKNSEGQVFDGNNLLDFVVDQGLGIRSGENVVLKQYDTRGIKSRRLRDQVQNFMRWMTLHPNVKRSTVSEGQLTSDQLAEMSSAPNNGIGQVLGERVHGKNIFEVLESVGIPMGSRAYMDNVIFEGQRHLYTGVRTTDWDILEAFRSEAQTYDYGTGPRIVLPVVKASEALVVPERLESLDALRMEAPSWEAKPFEFDAQNMQKVADALGRSDLKIALTQEGLDALTGAVERLTRAGVIDGFATESGHIQGEGVPDRGVIALYNSGQARGLERIARAIDSARTMDMVQFETDLAQAYGGFMQQIRSDKKMSVSRKKNAIALVRAMQKVRQRGGLAYRQVLKYMMDEGVIEIGRGFDRKQFKIPSDKQAVRYADRIINYLEAMDTVSSLGAIAEGRGSNQISKDAYELIRGEGQSKTNPSTFMNKIGMREPLGQVETVAALRGAVESVARGEVTHEHLPQEIIRRVEEVIQGYVLRDAQGHSMAKLREMKPNELISIAGALRTSFELPEHRIGMDILTPESATPVVPGEGATTTPDLSRSKIGNVAKLKTVPRKFWHPIHEQVAKVHFISGEAADQRGFMTDLYSERGATLFKDISRRLFRDGLHSIRENPDGTVEALADSPPLMILMPKASETGGFFGMELPRDAALRADGELTYRGKMHAELDRLIGIYENSGVNNNALAEVLKGARMYRDVLASDADLLSFYKGQGGEGYRNRHLLMQSISELITYSRMFGTEVMTDMLRKASHIGGINEAAKIKAREKLITADSLQGVDADIAHAQALDYMKGKKLNARDLESAGMTFGEDGRLKGAKFVVYDDVAVGERNQRGLTQEDLEVAAREGREAESSPETDSSVWVTPEYMNLMYHMFGRDGVRNAFGVGKLKFLARDGESILGSKDALFTDPDVTRILNQNGIAGIISKSALKLLSGSYATDAPVLKFKGGEIDFKRVLQEKGDLAFEGVEPIEIKMSEVDWQLEVDHAPTKAIISVQQGNYKDPAVVKGLVDRYFDRTISRLKNTWGDMFGDSFSPESNHMMREFFLERMKHRDAHPDELASRGWQMDYLASSVYASPNHFGMSQHALDVAMRSFIQDTMMKGQTSVGSHAVYAPDLFDAIRPGEAYAPGQAREIVMDSTALQEVTIGFHRSDLKEPTAIEQVNDAYWGWSKDGRKAHYNTKAEGENVPAQQPASVESVRLFQGGSKGGIGPGLMQIWRTSADRKVGSRPAVTFEGEGGRTRSGSKSIFGLMNRKGMSEADAQRLAGAINDAYQAMIFSQDYDGGVASARKAIAKAMKGEGLKLEKGELPVDALADRIVEDLESVWHLTWGTWDKAQAHQVKIGGLHDGLAFLFGENVYGRRGGEVEFGLMAAGQRHPSSLQNDLMPLMVKGFLDRDAYGQQIRMSQWDAERIMKADFDKDEINFWFDNPREVMGGIQRTRGISGGFREPELPKMTDFKMFADQNGESSHMLWSRRLREGKQGIGIIQRGVHNVSNMINKGIAFRFQDAEGEWQVEPIGRMETIQSEFHDAILDSAKRANQFFDAKKGVPTETLAQMDLQGEVLGKFYVMRRVGEKGQLMQPEALTPQGMEIMKAATSLFGRLSGVTSGFSDASQSMSTMSRIASRYKAVMGGSEVGAKDRLRNYMVIALAAGHPIKFTGKATRMWDHGDVDGRRIELMKNKGMVQLLESIQPVDPSFGKMDLKATTIMDSVAEGIANFSGAVEHGYESSYLSTVEAKAIKTTLDLSQSWASEIKNARATAWALNMDNFRGQIDQLRTHAEYGEGSLAYEAALGELLLRQYDYWGERATEASFAKGERWQPQSGMELRQALNEYADGVSIKLARSIVPDLRPDQAADRYEAALGIRQMYGDDFRQLNKRKFGPPSIEDITINKIQAKLDIEIADYMARYGKGNEQAAMLDLVDAVPFGYFYSKGNILTRYRKFPQMIWRTAAKHGMPKYAPDIQADMTPEMASVVSKGLYETMGEARALVGAAMKGDLHSLQEIRSWIEATESGGRSFGSAMNAAMLGRYPSRFRRMRENLFTAKANAELKSEMRRHEVEELKMADGNRETDQPVDMLNDPNIGFRDRRDAISFVNMMADGTLDGVAFARILRGRQANAGIWPERLLDGVTGAESLMIKRGVSDPTPKMGFFESKLWGRLKGEVRADDAAAFADAKRRDMKPPQKKSPQDVVDAAIKKERDLLSLLIRTMDSRTESAPLPREGFEGNSIVDDMLKIDFEKECI